jgi:helix-turn-helix protein
MYQKTGVPHMTAELYNKVKSIPLKNEFGLKKSDLMVLENLAWHTNEDGICWPSQELISSETRLGKSTVRLSVSNLKKLGVLKVLREKFYLNNTYSIQQKFLSGLFDVQKSDLPDPMVGSPRSNGRITPKYILNKYNKKINKKDSTYQFKPDKLHIGKQKNRPEKNYLNGPIHLSKVSRTPNIFTQVIEFVNTISKKTYLCDATYLEAYEKLFMTKMHAWKKINSDLDFLSAVKGALFKRYRLWNQGTCKDIGMDNSFKPKTLFKEEQFDDYMSSWYSAYCEKLVRMRGISIGKCQTCNSPLFEKECACGTYNAISVDFHRNSDPDNHKIWLSQLADKYFNGDITLAEKHCEDSLRQYKNK